RYERRVDPEGAERAAARAAGLLVDLAGARATGTDLVRASEPPAWATRPTVTVRPERVERLLGLELPAPRQAQLLRRAGVEVESRDGELVATPPSWRGDLNREA